jgi:hypothetical protein
METTTNPRGWTSVDTSVPEDERPTPQPTPIVLRFDGELPPPATFLRIAEWFEHIYGAQFTERPRRNGWVQMENVADNCRNIFGKLS